MRSNKVLELLQILCFWQRSLLRQKEVLTYVATVTLVFILDNATAHFVCAKKLKLVLGSETGLFKSITPYNAVVMTIAIARVHTVHLMNADWTPCGSNPQQSWAVGCSHPLSHCHLLLLLLSVKADTVLISPDVQSAFHPFGVDKWVVSCNWMSAASVAVVVTAGECSRSKGRHGVVCR